MRFKPIHVYVGGVCGLALGLLFSVEWSALFSLSSADLLGLGALIGLGLLSESLAISFRVGKGSGQSSITFLPLLTGMLVFGVPGTVLFIATTGVIGEFLVRRKPPVKAVFNNAQWVIATIAGGSIFSVLGGVPLVGMPPAGGIGFTDLILPFVAFTISFLSLNHSAVALAIALSQEERFTRVLRTFLGPTGTNVLYDLLVSPIALGVAILYNQFQAVGLVIAILPLLFIRHSYLNSLRLERANRDLLKALVKAIETRDPYTSGHSRRVSMLARRIAVEMRLPTRRVEAIETAALLHDIGKIEAVYDHILKKPDVLSDSERRVIESHVTKGVELLQSLASLPSNVIAAVSHHHERVDGHGYPNGIAGAEISLGGRIIKICDAVDAMLSDRPYRKALAIPTVREQLELFAGTQFDAAIVRHVVTGSLLEDHARNVRAVRENREPLAPADNELPSLAMQLPSISRLRRNQPSDAV